MAGLNEALLAKAAGQKLLRTSRLRADPPWCPRMSPTRPTRGCWPGRSGGSRRPAGDPGRGRRHQDQGAGPQPGGGQAAHAIAVKLRSRAAQARDDKQAAVGRATGSWPGWPDGRRRRAAAVANACRALRRAEAKAAALAAAGLDAAGRRPGRLRRAVNDLAGLLEVTVRSRRKRGSGSRARCRTGRPGGSACTSRTPGRSPRAVSASPSSSGTRPSSSTTTTASRRYAVEQGNPADGPQLAPAVQRVIKRTGTTPRTVTADRSYGEKAIEDDLHGLGVRHVVIPRKGKPGKARQAAERRPAFRRAVKWRTGSEGRISTLKRRYGGTAPPGQHRGSPDLGRARRPRPQPGQDQRPGQLTPAAPLARPRPTQPSNFFRSK